MLGGHDATGYRPWRDHFVGVVTTNAPTATRAPGGTDSGVGTKTVREVHERRYAARLGAMAPVLKLLEKLLLGRA